MIKGLIEISLPQPVSYWPQTIGWYILFGLLFLAAAWMGYRRYRYHKTNKYRRWALTKLDDIERVLKQDWGKEKTLSEIPVLVKRTALHCFPRENIASLSGDDWLRFLDTSYGGTDFHSGPGKILEQTAYRNAQQLEQYKKEDIQQLIDVVRRWIKKHRSQP